MLIPVKILVFLSKEELIEAREVLTNTTTGLYVLSAIYGIEMWSSIPKPTKFGLRFKQSVDSGCLKGIKYKGKGSDNIVIYFVE